MCSLTRFQHSCMRVYTSFGQLSGFFRRWPDNSCGRNYTPSFFLGLVWTNVFHMLRLPCLSPPGCVGPDMVSAHLTRAPTSQLLNENPPCIITSHVSQQKIGLCWWRILAMWQWAPSCPSFAHILLTHAYWYMCTHQMTRHQTWWWTWVAAQWALEQPI